MLWQRQRQAQVPPSRDDCIVLTSPGKTLAFLVPIVELLQKEQNPGNVSVVILTPIRELAQQTHDELKKLTKFCPNIKHKTLFGGEKVYR